MLVLLCWWRKRADNSLSHRGVQLIKEEGLWDGECDAIKAGPSLRATPDVQRIRPSAHAVFFLFFFQMDETYMVPELNESLKMYLLNMYLLSFS